MTEYIEREAALEAIMGQPPDAHYPDWYAKDIKKIPAADVVEVRHGRWIWDEDAMDWGLGAWVCSECQVKNDNIPANSDIHPYNWVGSSFCPNCGAKMDGKEVEKE